MERFFSVSWVWLTVLFFFRLRWAWLIVLFFEMSVIDCYIFFWLSLIDCFGLVDWAWLTVLFFGGAWLIAWCCFFCRLSWMNSEGRSFPWRRGWGSWKQSRPTGWFSPVSMEKVSVVDLDTDRFLHCPFCWNLIGSRSRFIFTKNWKGVQLWKNTQVFKTQIPYIVLDLREGCPWLQRNP